MTRMYAEIFARRFIGSFKLAFAIVLSVIEVGAVFVRGGGDAALNAARRIRRPT